jgi:hypothetical protein
MGRPCECAVPCRVSDLVPRRCSGSEGASGEPDGISGKKSAATKSKDLWRSTGLATLACPDSGRGVGCGSHNRETVAHNQFDLRGPDERCGVTLAADLRFLKGHPMSSPVLPPAIFLMDHNPNDRDTSPW